jgi:hypothetical protein
VHALAFLRQFDSIHRFVLQFHRSMAVATGTESISLPRLVPLVHHWVPASGVDSRSRWTMLTNIVATTWKGRRKSHFSSHFIRTNVVHIVKKNLHNIG